MSKSSTPLPFYNPLDTTRPKLWPDYTLIMPVCAVGNIGQLACDLIVSTLISQQECQLVGRLYSPALMAVVGPNAFTLNGPPTTSTEVYESKKHNLVILQQRTSYYKNLKGLYIEELVHWLKESKFDNVLVLTSSFAQCNPDTSQLGENSSCPIRSITTSAYETGDILTRLNVKPVPDRKTSKVVQDGLTFLPGSGITKPLIKACEKASIRAAFLIHFCSEGINVRDCYEVVNIVDKMLDLSCGVSISGGGGGSQSKLSADVNHGGDDSTVKKSGWVEPFSWNQAHVDPVETTDCYMS